MISAEIKNIPLQFETEGTLFSPGAIDTGTLAMLSVCEFTPEDKVLDLGCGYGVVGILAGKLAGAGQVTMCDISEKAVEASRKNAALNGMPELTIVVSNGFENIEEQGFTKILSNPPYHTDFSVAKHFIEEGYRRLVQSGRMYMVTKRLDWYRNKLQSVFGGVRVHEIDGYYIFVAEKRARAPKKEEKPKNKLSKKLARKYGKK